MTRQTLDILAVMSEDPLVERYGLEIAKATGLKSGTMYPSLARLEEAGILASRWEDVDARTVGRPRRRLYSLTAEGARIASLELRRGASSRATETVLRPLPRPA